MNVHLTRRDFVRASAAGLAAAASGVWSELPAAESKSPSEKLNIGFVGTSGQANFSLDNCTSQNIAALCDVDDKLLAKAAAKFPAARKYNDFRKLLDDDKTIDALVVATPDHIHAPASVNAMKLGKHVYCEKPLTHSVHEARVCAETAAKYKVATQMGTQIHAGENYRRVVEIIQAGTLGKVSEVHVWVGKGWGGGERPKSSAPPPDHLHWDLWLGPAPYRDFYPKVYQPQEWRRWWDFGGGTLGDMACHYMDLPFWALALRHPSRVSAEGAKVHEETCPLGLKVFYEFPARSADLPACKLTWYDGDAIPKMVAGHKVPGSGVMFIGEKGQFYANYDQYMLYPQEAFKGFVEPEKTIPRSLGHHAEWIKACKEGSPTTCNFDYSGALTEAVLLGNVAYRTGQQLAWDPKTLKATNCPDADQFLQRAYRKGWTL